MKIVGPFIFTIFFCINLGFSQLTTSGYVRDAISEEPLVGVSVFYDGTTIGTITDEKGFFELTTRNRMTANLIISFIGYQTQILDGGETGRLVNILLVEQAIQLDEVVLKPDTWSRQKKLNIFRKAFLGSTSSGLRCKILNEQDIRLYYNKDKNTLFAYASKQLQIENRFLGYRITYDLNDFQAVFKQTSSINLQTATYFGGTAFFSELDSKKTNGKYVRRRENLYKGSVLHFMRALSEKHLEEEGFIIFKDKLQIEPYAEYEIVNADGLVEITQKVKLLGILYNEMHRSSIGVVENPFYVDKYGNHYPSKNLRFAGKMANPRMGGMLPMDYGL